MSVKKLSARLSVLFVMLLSCATIFAQDEQEVTYPQVVGRGEGKFTITVGDAGDIMKLFDSSNPNYSDWELVRQASDLRIVSAEGTTVVLSAGQGASNNNTDLGYLCHNFSNLTTIDLSGVNIENADKGGTEDWKNPLKQLSFCSTLANITFPIQNNLNIPNQCFKNNTHLQSIIIPDYPEGQKYKLGTGAFEKCTALLRVALGKGTRSIGGDPIATPPDGSLMSPKDDRFYKGEGGGVFMGCSSLYSLVLDDDITCIRATAFQDCTSLAYVKLPNNLTTIGPNAFDNCTSMITLTIPKHMKYWGGNAFARMYNLRDVYLLAEDIPLPLGGDQGGPFNINQTTNFTYTAGDNPTYSQDDYTTTQTNGQYKMAILHYPATDAAKQNYRWTDAQGYHLIDANGTTWPDQTNIDHFMQAKENFDLENDIYVGWKFFLQGNQNEKRDDIIPITRFKESRWYSVCYPFDLTIDKFQNAFGVLAALSEFSDISYDEETGTMTIRFEAPAVNWASNNVILKKNHAYMIHPDKLVVSDDEPIQIFGVNNELEHYRLQSVFDDLTAKGLTAEQIHEMGILTNNEVDAFNRNYNSDVWEFTATAEDNDGNTRIRHYFDKDNVMYYFKGNYMGGVQLPKGSYYLGGSLAANNYGFYYRKSTGSTWTPYTAILVHDEGAETSAPAKVSFDCIEDAVVENTQGQQATAIDNELFVRIPVKSTGKAYNMQGQQVGANGIKGLPKGLYIVNGKKYIVK